MVGQEHNLQVLQQFADEGEFPRFIIITGEPGSGKKTLARHISKNILEAVLVTPGNTVEAVREAIETAYKCQFLTVYLFADTDKMSTQAKNALLKITEEPPKQAHFIITVSDINNTLATLKSRGVEIQMSPYTKTQLKQLIPPDARDFRRIFDIAQNPGQIEQLLQIDVENFYNFCEKVICNIDSVSGTNAFKIVGSLKTKEDGAGYDPILFLNAIQVVCETLMKEEDVDVKAYATMIKVCAKYKNELLLTGVKKDSTLDMWVLDMRRALDETT
jgi:tRNA A37 threonylcarbamoyladenosine biosynthesis protein TsaE